MGNDGFRVLRMAFVGRRDPKEFLEALQRNPRADARKSTTSSKTTRRCVREAGIFDAALA